MIDTDFYNIIDSHFHLMEMKKKEQNIDTILANIFENGFKYALDIGTILYDFNERLTYAKHYKNLFLTAGLYPSEADNVNLDKELQELSNICTENPEVIAIGEIGLDYYRNYSARHRQIELFDKQLDIALKHDLPVVIHNREADEDIYNILKSKTGIQGVMHCYSSDKKWASKFIALGFYISFSGSVTYKNSQKQQEACRYIPTNRLLIETDAPYLAAREIRGRLNSPEFIIYTYKFISELRNTEMEILKTSIIENFEKLFNIPS